MWPKCAFGDQATKKASFGKTTCRLAIPPNMGKKLWIFFKNNRCFYVLLVMGQKVAILGQKWCFGVSWTGCEVADLHEPKIGNSRNGP